MLANSSFKLNVIESPPNTVQAIAVWSVSVNDLLCVREKYTYFVFFFLKNVVFDISPLIKKNGCEHKTCYKRLILKKRWE